MKKINEKHVHNCAYVCECFLENGIKDGACFKHATKKTLGLDKKMKTSLDFVTEVKYIF